MQVIKSTPASQIPDLKEVRDRYIRNYNACHRGNQGELMYARNVVHFKQIVTGNERLNNADPFSLYACFLTAAANGYSFDPNDSEVYLVPRDGKAFLDRQAGAYIRRLIRTGQIIFAEQAKLVYEGDTFEVMNGRVIRHIESFKSDIIIAGYIRMVIDDNGADRFFIYRKSDFESWRRKSPNPRTIEKNGRNGAYLSESLWDNGILGGHSPEPNFLRTKIAKHAAKEKCWASGNAPAVVESFSEVEIDTDDETGKMKVEETHYLQQPAPQPAAIPAGQPVHQSANEDDFAAPAAAPMATVTHDDDDF